jgi:hypothetical protein
MLPPLGRPRVAGGRAVTEHKLVMDETELDTTFGRGGRTATDRPRSPAKPHSDGRLGEASTLEDPGRSDTQGWIYRTLREAGWAPLLVLLVYFVTARVLDLFQPFPNLDIPMHFAGGMAASYFFYRAMRIGARLGVLRRRDRMGTAFIVFGLTLAVALLWEFGEALSDRLYGTHEQLGPWDTITDVLVGMVGSVALLTLMSSSAAKRNR